MDSEIDLDVDGHIVIDKWLYISFERTVNFSRICSVILNYHYD